MSDQYPPADMPLDVLPETDGHVHDWRPGLSTTSVNYHLDGTTPASFHTHTIPPGFADSLPASTSAALNEADDRWHCHARTVEP